MVVDIKSSFNNDGRKLSSICEASNAKVKENGSSQQVNNRKVKLLVWNHFGNRAAFTSSKNSRKSQMCFAADKCKVEPLAETIWETDTIK